MNIRYDITGKDRKALAAAVGEAIGKPVTYAAAPTFAYVVGKYVINREATLDGPNDRDLVETLAAQGFQPTETLYNAEAPVEPEAETEPAPAKPDKTDLPRLYTLITPRGEISITEEFATRDEADAEGYGEAFSTRLGTVYSYGDSRTFALVTESKAGDWDTTTMGRDFREAAPAEEMPKRKGGIMDCLVEALNEDAGDGEKWERLHRQPTIIDNSGREHNLDGTFAAQAENTEQPDCVCIEMPLDGFTPEKLDNLCRMVTAKEALIKQALGIDGPLPVQVLEDRIAFPWFTATNDGAHIEAYAQLIAAICRTAKEKQRVTAQPKEEHPNPRFTMRCWLITLGLVGPEYRLIRALMTKTLPGNGAWSKGIDPRQVELATAKAAEATAPEKIAEPAGDLPGEAPAEESEETANG